jgi:hypothetical protein
MIVTKKLGESMTGNIAYLDNNPITDLVSMVLNSLVKVMGCKT